MPVSGAEVLRAAFPRVPRVALVLGSGLSSVSDVLQEQVTVPFRAIPDLPPAAVEGHQGRFVFGRLGTADVVVQAGRVHAYEGHGQEAVVAPVRLLAALGVDTLILTNAAGAIDRRIDPGDVVLIDDQINLTFRSPLSGPVRAHEARFPDMSAPFDPGLAAIIRQAAVDLRMELKEGSYAGVLGPSYETAAEVEMLARLGGHVVGMSTIPEVIAARALGLRCAALSLITNRATGRSLEPLAHDDVLSRGREAGERVACLLERVVIALQSTEAK